MPPEPKNCIICGEEFFPVKHNNQLTCGSPNCKKAHRKQWLKKYLKKKREHKQNVPPSIPVKPPVCPLLEKCKKAFGIDCSNRNYKQCGFYQNLKKEKELKKARKRGKKSEENVNAERTDAWRKYLEGYRERNSIEVSKKIQ